MSIPPSVKLVAPMPPLLTITGISIFTVAVAPDPLVFTPVPPATVRALAAGVAVPESVGKDIGTAADAFSVSVDAAPAVDIPVPPITLRLFPEAIAVPESETKLIGETEEAVIVTVFPDPAVETPIPPKISRELDEDRAVPESVGTDRFEEVTAAMEIVPAPFVTIIPLPAVKVETAGSPVVVFPIKSWPSDAGSSNLISILLEAGVPIVLMIP
jgi:hypothetical protein